MSLIYLPILMACKHDFWNCFLESVVNEHGPTRKELVREKDMPYMTFEWKNAMRKKRKYAMIFSKNRTQKPQEPHFKKYHNLATKEHNLATKEQKIGRAL